MCKLSYDGLICFCPWLYKRLYNDQDLGAFSLNSQFALVIGENYMKIICCGMGILFKSVKTLQDKLDFTARL